VKHNPSANNKDMNRHSLPQSLMASREIAVRLGLALGLLVVLLIAVGDLGLRRVDRVNVDLQEIMSTQWNKIRLPQEAVTYSNRNSRITMQRFLLNDRKPIDTILKNRVENSTEISDSLAKLEGLCQSEEERRQLIAIEAARTRYIASYLQALSLLLYEGKRDAAVAVVPQQATPALLEYHAARDEFVNFQGNQLELLSRQSKERYAAARRSALTILIAVVAMAVAMAGGIAFFATSRMVREITARLRDERQALQAAHREAEVFIDAVPSILIGVDQDSHITRWNLTAASAFGLSRAEVVGKRLADCGVKWLRPDMPEEIRSWCSERTSRRCDHVPFEMNSETRLLGLTITAVRVSDKDSAELLVIGSDVTYRSALEVQLRQAQKLESVGQLAAGIAHEINTPIQYIGDNVRFLNDSFQDLKALLTNYDRLLSAAKDKVLSDETVKEVATAVQRADAGYLLEEIPKAIEQTLEGITRVSTLVSAMKEFSHPGTKEKTPLNLNHAIESTITVARNEWKYVADVETKFDSSLPPISCQPGEFNQVILNLIVNAAHAISDVVEKGGPKKGTIQVQTLNFPDWVEVRIGDTGSGIPEKVRARIFDPFFTTKEIGKGTGQGLAIARSVVVDKHGGSIQFETKEGKGTTFVIRLPHDGKSLSAKAASA
jgi:signal transduction histidine kinase